MWYHLKGIHLSDQERNRRSLGHSQVLAPEIRVFEKAQVVGRRLTLKAASRLRRMGLVASLISLSIRLENEGSFRLDLPCDRMDDSLTFLSLFQEMWDQIGRQIGSVRIRKVSITFSKLQELVSGQYEFFIDHCQEKRRKACKALDLINQKYGKDSVSFGIPVEDFHTKIAFTRIPDIEEFF